MELFKNRSRDLLNHINGYLGYVTETALHLEEAFDDYLQGRRDEFERRCSEVADIERMADESLKAVKYELYAFMLIPDTRADVYKLMDDLDDVIDETKDLLVELSIEAPEIPQHIVDDMQRLAQASSKAAQALVKAVRAFFSQMKSVEGQVDKVVFYEKEADHLEVAIKRSVFSSPDITECGRKMQLRFLTERIALLSDISEDIAKNLLIYTVKRKI